MRKVLTTLLAAFMLVGLLALPAAANDGYDGDLVDFAQEQADKNRGRYNIIGSAVSLLVSEGLLPENALRNEELTVFFPTDIAFRRLVGDLTGQRWWRVSEADALQAVLDNYDPAVIATIVGYHVIDPTFAGKVDYRTARSLDDNRRNGTDVFVPMFAGGDLGIDRRGRFLQLDDAGVVGPTLAPPAGLPVDNTNPWVVDRNVDAGNALVHGISEVLVP